MRALVYMPKPMQRENIALVKRHMEVVSSFSWFLELNSRDLPTMVERQSMSAAERKVTVTPMPYMITITPEGGDKFTAAQAEIYADGIRVGAGGETFPLPEGKHTIEIKANGYKTKTLSLDVKSDQTVTTTLEQ